ncbi:hypothetical protein N7G274_003686 [Stereocaulon virgatum]|uniref:Uncharacterized protein n=1 Tax=Stereocaulon virgatum TaxID=373712 RepID=A0ABR4AE32_9LECA
MAGPTHMPSSKMHGIIYRLVVSKIVIAQPGLFSSMKRNRPPRIITRAPPRTALRTAYPIAISRMAPKMVVRIADSSFTPTVNDSRTAYESTDASGSS